MPAANLAHDRHPRVCEDLKAPRCFLADRTAATTHTAAVILANRSRKLLRSTAAWSLSRNLRGAREGANTSSAAADKLPQTITKSSPGVLQRSRPCRVDCAATTPNDAMCTAGTHDATLDSPHRAVVSSITPSPSAPLRGDGCLHASRGGSDLSRDLMRPLDAAGSTSKKGQNSWRCLVFCQFGRIQLFNASSSRKAHDAYHTSGYTLSCYMCFEACLLLLGSGTFPFWKHWSLALCVLSFVQK